MVHKPTMLGGGHRGQCAWSFCRMRVCCDCCDAWRRAPPLDQQVVLVVGAGVGVGASVRACVSVSVNVGVV